jgi:hypothetical protein
MDRGLILFFIGLVFGGGIGFVTAAGNNITLDGHEHSAHVAQEMNGSMQHGTAAGGLHDHSELLSIPGGPDAPALKVAVLPDPVSGWNLKVSVQNFRFAPEHASLEHVPGEGHAHVYVNGEKIARLYGAWLHLSSLPEGGAVVEVTLNSNDHRQLVVDGELVGASVTVNRN